MLTDPGQQQLQQQPVRKQAGSPETHALSGCPDLSTAVLVPLPKRNRMRSWLKESLLEFVAFLSPSMSFPHALNCSVVLDSSDEDGKTPGGPAADEQNRTVKMKIEPPAAEPVVIDISSEEDNAQETSQPLAAFLKAMWRDHEGHGACTGSNELPCCFGKDGQAANAGPDGRCDLCSGPTIRMLHEHSYAHRRLTFLLKQLHGRPLLHALVRIKLVLGPEARDIYRKRRMAALKGKVTRRRPA